MSNGGLPTGGGFDHIGRTLSDAMRVSSPPLDGEEDRPPPTEDKEKWTPPDRDKAQRLIRWADPTQTVNVCDEILSDSKNFQDGESLLGKIGQRVVEETRIDEMSRDSWLKQTTLARDLAMQVAKPKTNPWPESSNLIYPLISTAAINFNARSLPAIIQAEDVVKGLVVGPDVGKPMQGPDGQQMPDPASPDHLMWIKDSLGRPIDPGYKRSRADRVAQHMSWQCLEEMEEWVTETDQLLIILPIVGCIFRKSFFDANEQRNSAVLVLAENLIINYMAKSMGTAPRLTEVLKLYPYEVEEQIRAGAFLDHQLGYAQSSQMGDVDAPHEYEEQHRRWDLDGDGYPEPFIVTVHRQSAKVVRMMGRYDPDGVHFNKDTNKIQRVRAVDYYTKYDFLPNPEKGIYGMGFGQLLNPINQSINTTLNQMFDAETLKIHGGGFIGKGLVMAGGTVKLRLGEWKTVNSLGAAIKDSIVPLEHQGANTVLMALLTFLVDAGKELAANTEVLSGKQTEANIPATTTLALIEQGLKVYSSIYKRVYLALKSEFQKLFRLNRLFLNRQATYRRGDTWKIITQDDYSENTGVAPIADPSMITDMQELARAEFLKDFVNDIYVDGIEVRRRMFKAAKISDPESLIHTDPMQNPGMMMRMREIGLQEIKEKSHALFHLARAMQALALGDKAVGDMHLAAISQWFEQSVQSDLQRLNTATPQQLQNPAPDAPPVVPMPVLPSDPPGVGTGKTSTGGGGFGGGESG